MLWCEGKMLTVDVCMVTAETWSLTSFSPLSDESCFQWRKSRSTAAQDWTWFSAGSLGNMTGEVWVWTGLHPTKETISPQLSLTSRALPLVTKIIQLLCAMSYCAASLWQWDLVLWSTRRWRQPTTSGQTRPLTSWCRDIASMVATAGRILPPRGLHCVYVIVYIQYNVGLV